MMRVKKFSRLSQRGPDDWTLEEIIPEIDTGKEISRHITDVLIYWMSDDKQTAKIVRVVRL